MIVILKGLKASIKPLPWVPQVFSRVRRGASFRRSKAEDTSGEAETQNRAWKASGTQGIKP